jgi:hypothetical protein
LVIAAVLFLFVAPIDVPVPDATRSQAQGFAVIGQYQLQRGRPTEAKVNCESAAKAEPGNEMARDCLFRIQSMLIDEDLNNADADLLNGDKTDAIALASRWARAGSSQAQRERAWAILSRAKRRNVTEWWEFFFPNWLRELLTTLAILIAFTLLLLAIKWMWQKWQRGRWYGTSTKTNWSMLPLLELPKADPATGIPTDALLDALSRVGHELDRPLWEPHLLLLRPTPPADYEPAIISEFLSDPLPEIVLTPAAMDLRLEWQLHDVQLDQAVQNLQIRTATGIDIGSVARFLRTIIQWINSGAPSISGVAQTDPDKSVSIHVVARGGRLRSVAVGSSTNFAPGIDCAQLSAERSALKFLFRMRYPFMTNDQIDGFAALRQGASQFSQYAGTVPSVGDDARVRTSSLEKAAFNFGFFRSSIPPHCAPVPPSDQCQSLLVTDELRQAVLLAEGVANALVGGELHWSAALDCFRQLEDWPGSPETEPLRQQATYNEAIVWLHKREAGRCVLMLTELLGETAPDLAVEGKESIYSVIQRSDLSASIRFPVRLARLTALASYSRDEWSALPRSRADLILGDGANLRAELETILQNHDLSQHDLRLARYMYIETLRAIGHIQLLYVVTGGAVVLYHDKRPTGLKNGAVDDDSRKRLQLAISWMRMCEEVAPKCPLFCDLAEAYLLLKDFTKAGGYARHATLESSLHADEREYCEWAYYLAAETFLLQNTDESKALAKNYAEGFKGDITLDEFRSVRAELNIPAVIQVPVPTTTTPKPAI